MTKTLKPNLVALIREAECIGCSKCIPACPFDAILGAPKHMHTVITDECIGCKLCVPACPVDCIDMLLDSANDDVAFKSKINQARKRYKTRQKRLEQEKVSEAAKLNTQDDKKRYIQDAMARMKLKKLAPPNK